MTLLDGHLDDAHSHIAGDFTHPRQGRVDTPLCLLFVVEAIRQREGALGDHLIADASGLAEGARQADAGEDVKVVSLARNEVLSLVVELGKWASRSKDDGTLGSLDGRLKVALGQVRRVGEREDDRALVELSHALEDLLREGVWDSAEANDSRRLNVFDGLDEGLALLALVVVS